MFFGGRARGGDRRRVQRGLAAQQTWQVEAAGSWICPFCAAPAVTVPPERAELEERVLEHLEEACPDYAGGEGAERPLLELRKVAAYRELRRKVKDELIKNPSWQLLDLSRRWFCPFCGEATEVSVPASKKMGEESLRGIIAHVEQCYAYDRGRGQEKPFAHLKAVVKHTNQSRKLAENVRRKLEGDPLWRRKDPAGRWICPYCLETQAHIDLSTNLLMFENAPALIAKHLAGACGEFRAGAEPQPLEAQPRGAGESGSSLGPIPATDPRGRSRRDVEREEAVPDLTMPRPPRETVRFARREVGPSETGPTELGSGLLRRKRDEGERRGTAVWGRDALHAEDLGARGTGRGTTLRALESSGEFMLVDDEVRSITAQPRSSSEERRAAEVWRAEIERELAAVREELPELPGQLGAGSEPSLPPAGGEAGVDPALLRSHGYELGALQLMADPPRGDFAEALELGGGRVALIAGGVTGEEREAPLIAAMARTLLRERAAPDRCPREVLREVNRALFADLDGRSFVAVGYALVDLASGRARLARAGLAAPLLRRTRGAPRLLPLDVEGMVMGIDQGPIFDSTLDVRPLELVSGDVLVLFGNAALEARGEAREEFGLERVHRLIDRYGGHEVEYLTDKFREAFEQHADRPGQRTAEASLVALRRGLGP